MQAWFQNTCADLSPRNFQVAHRSKRGENAIAYSQLVRAVVLWPNGTTVTYSYLPGAAVGTSNQQSKVNKVITEWSKYANITFQLVDATASPVPMIRISFEPTTGNWSVLGNLAQNVSPENATMNLGWVLDSVDEQPHERGVILHEFGHALGLMHEHSLATRVDEQATRTFYETSQGWSDADVQSRILDVYNTGSLSNYVQVDSLSVMKFFMPNEMSIERVDVYPNNNLSDHDKAFMVINYPRPTIDPAAPQWTLNHALDVMNVPAYDKHAMLLARPDDVRKQFALWLTERVLSTATIGFPLPIPGGDIPTLPDWFSRACSDLAEHEDVMVDDSEDPRRIERAVITRTDNLWTNGSEITYTFLKSQDSRGNSTGIVEGNSIQKAKVRQVIKEWEKWANVTFVEKDASNPGDIRIAFKKNDGSWSYVGKQIRAQPTSKTTMNFGWVGGDESAITPKERGVILHEFGHALGMLHEHESPARGGVLTLNVENVRRYYMETQRWDQATVDQQIIRLYSASEISNFSELDTDSIMMYFMPKEMNEERIEVEPNYELSNMDKAYMTLNYPFFSTSSRRGNMTREAALRQVGMRDTERAWRTIMDSTSAAEIRQEFTDWSDIQRARYLATLPSRGADDDPIEPGRGVEEVVPSWYRHVCADLAEHEDIMVNDSEDPRKISRATITRTDNLWPNESTITYTFLLAKDAYGNSTGFKEGNEVQKAKVRFIIKEWEKWANISFVETDAAHPGYIRISFNPASGAWAYEGMQMKSQPVRQATMNLGYLPDTLVEYITDDERGVVLHEFGHALGMLHEHQSPARGGILTLNLENVRQFYMTTQQWSQKLVDEQIIRLYNTTEISNYSELDTTSIMMYFMPKEMNLQGIEVKPNKWLSDKDKAYMTLNYPFLSSSRRKGSMSREEALRIVGMHTTDPAWNVIMRSTNADEIRERFTQWSDVQRAVYLNQPTGGGQEHGIDDGFPPQRDTEVTEPVTNPATVFEEGDFLDKLWNSLQQFFRPGGNQSFALQFPGRFLQISQYAWDTGSAGVYGQFIKPVVVNESEFRLTDQLYDDAKIISGPNGISLSQVYDQLINNLLPVFRSNGLAQQQDQIRQWLLRDVKVSGWIRDLLDAQHTAGLPQSLDDSDGIENEGIGSATVGQPAFAISDKVEDGKVNRMELSNALMQEYLQAKQAWEVERDGMIEAALELKLGTADSNSALNELTRKLAHTTAIREAQLASKYSDAVVRGYTHNVREYVGYLDVKSAAEALQDAKDSLREAAMSSLDGSLKVYPVQMTPIDWFEGLSTSFKLEDLTGDPDLIYQQIKMKSAQLDALNSQLVSLRLGSQGDPTALRNAVANAQKALDNASSDLARKYTSNIISLAKTCYTLSGALDPEQVRQLGTKGDIPPGIVENLITDLNATSVAQNNLTGASRAYSQALAGYALAQATDTQQEQEQIRLRVESITSEIDELTARYTSLNKSGSRPGENPPPTTSVNAVPDFPVANDTAGGSRWQEILMNHRIQSDYSRDTTAASATSTSSHANLFFFSAGSSSSSSQAYAAQDKRTYENDVTVAFRATLVTVDRAGWFQPQFFKQSGSFYHIDPSVSWSRSVNGSQALLPTFPVGYVLCKDITIKIRQTKSQGTIINQNMEKNASASGGILCFSYSASSSSSASDNSYSFQQCSDGCVIRIPGPQILGYILQRTDADQTGAMPRQLPQDFFIPDADYDAATGGLGGDPARGINAGGDESSSAAFFTSIDNILKKANASSSTINAVHAAVGKEFEKISEDVADRIRRG